MHEIDPCLTDLRERAISKIIVSQISTDTDLEDLPARRTFVSSDCHNNITAEIL